MRMMNYSVMRCVSAIAIGVLLMVWPEAAIIYLVIAIGAMFFLPSLFSLVGYFLKGRQLGMYFPIVSLGSLLFGLWLMVSPAHNTATKRPKSIVVAMELSITNFNCLRKTNMDIPGNNPIMTRADANTRKNTGSRKLSFNVFFDSCQIVPIMRFSLSC